MACKTIKKFLSEVRPNRDIPVIVAGDFNSVQRVQPEFFPPEQKAWVPSVENLPRAHRFSAVYSLFTFGYLDPEHLEHPDVFGSKTSKPEKKKGKGQGVCGLLSTGMKLANAYEVARDGKKLLFTTKTDTFCETLDYVWYTKSNLELAGVLEMPYQDKQADRFPFVPSREYPSDHLAVGSEFRFKK